MSGNYFAKKSGKNLVATIVQSSMCKTNAYPRPNPSIFYFPGLHSEPVFDNRHFECADYLTQNYSIILNEYKQLKSITKSDYKLTKDENTLHHGTWDWNSLYLKGKIQDHFVQSCPKTTEILLSIPSLMKSTPFAYSFFSTLTPGAIISPHYGPCNLRIRCHLPLIVPNGDCGMKIAGLDLKWNVGVPLFFDDCYQHEVWNRTQEDRVVLVFDMWHPDLHSEEILAIEDMFSYAKDKGWIGNAPSNSGPSDSSNSQSPFLSGKKK
jgi:aspartyl/asparaginyl beta-hydroxylase (cupin superfamily)